MDYHHFAGFFELQQVIQVFIAFGKLPIDSIDVIEYLQLSFSCRCVWPDFGDITSVGIVEAKRLSFLLRDLFGRDAEIADIKCYIQCLCVCCWVN
jgi:hypothetical protein